MSPELVHMYRGGLLDCIYRGDVAVVDALGTSSFGLAMWRKWHSCVLPPSRCKSCLC